MADQVDIQSKIIVQEGPEKFTRDLKQFFASYNLIGLSANSVDHILDAIKTNIDLGAIMLHEDSILVDQKAADLVLEVHNSRRELPVILMRKGRADLNDLPQGLRQAIAGAINTEDLTTLQPIIARFIFNTEYPNAMIRGVQQLTEESIGGIFKNISIDCAAPYLVNDRIIFGQLFTLIPIDSNWARGYLMFQTEEEPLEHFISRRKTALPPNEINFYSVNSILGELTNLVWGGFKNRYLITADGQPIKQYAFQVPIIVNHMHKYITFGSQDPHLCFRYKVTDSDDPSLSLIIEQRFVFNLLWVPEEFKEFEDVAEDLFETGELEFF